ncbi:hypothetical protein Tco_0306380 [Tanacetum coccineum]
MAHQQPSILGLAPSANASQATSLPSAFSTMTVQDPTWNMDTGSSSHLNFSTSNLSTIFNQQLFPSVFVGDGKTIPVTNTGHSIIPVDTKVGCTKIRPELGIIRVAWLRLLYQVNLDCETCALREKAPLGLPWDCLPRMPNL